MARRPIAGGYKFTYTASDEIVANIWNSHDRNWKVEVYENGNKTGEMTKQLRNSDWDAWGAGYHVGVPERESPSSHGNGHRTTISTTTSSKMPKQAQSRSAQPTVFGTVYTQNVFTTAAETDYPIGGQLSCGRRIAGQVILRIFILG